MKKIEANKILKVKTGKYDANHAKENGKYQFFTCALVPFWTDTFSFNDEVIILPGNGANVGEVLYYKGKLEAYQRTYVLYDIKANVKYLYYYFKKYWIRQITKKQVGSATNYIKMDDILSFEIPLPDLPTQQYIAKILDKADELRQYNKQLIEKYDALTQSLFLEMFGDPLSNEKGWETVQVENVASKDKHSIKAGPFGSSLKKEFYVEKGYKIYGQEQVIKDDMSFGDYYIDEKKYRELESCKVKEGDVLISLVGTYGKISVIPKKFELGIINPRLMKISPNKDIIRPDFLKFLLQSKHVEKQLKNHSRGGTMDIINVGIIRKIFIPLPNIELQNQFAERVQLIETQKQQAQEALMKSEALFQGLLHNAFKGELN
jgi:type I restriction enzyme S subunit